MIVAIILILILVFVLWGAWFSYRFAFFSKNDRPQDIYAIPPGEQYEKIADRMLEQIFQLEQERYEQVSITSYDGLKLAARYYHNQDNAPVIIQFHGYRGNSVREYSGGFKLAARVGYNSIVVDQRAHGLSQGHTISFGIRERYDCVAWVKYAAERFGAETPIILSGVSMGAATVLMASELRLPGNVRGIIADCPYSSPSAIIRRVCRNMKLPDKLIYPFVYLGARIFGRFDLQHSSAVHAVMHTKIPILLIHGEDDRFVPCDMSYEIFYHCAGEKEIVTVANAGHGISYLVDTKKYENAMERFIRKHCQI